MVQRNGRPIRRVGISSYSRLLLGYESGSTNGETLRGNGLSPFVRRPLPQRSAYHPLSGSVYEHHDDDRKCSDINA